MPIRNSIEPRPISIFVCIKEYIGAVVFVVTAQLASNCLSGKRTVPLTHEHNDMAVMLRYWVLRKSRGQTRCCAETLQPTSC